MRESRFSVHLGGEQVSEKEVVLMEPPWGRASDMVP